MPAIGVNMRVTAHYSQGERRYMEDTMSVAYQQTEDRQDFDFVYVGMFDGHGGAEAAAHAKEHLLEAIVKQRGFWSSRDADVLRAIRHGYILTHHNMWREIEKWPMNVNGLPSTAGTTASVAFIRRGKIYIGHVGDSAVVLGYKGEGDKKWSAKQLTLDHKPGIEPEISRIRSSGGKVIPKLGIPRVVWRKPVIGAADRRCDEIPFLAIARSLGDLWSYNWDTDEFIVSPDPDVGVIKIDPSKFRCLIFGTDGLWNMISPEKAVNIVYDAERHNEKELNSGDNHQPIWLNPSQKLVDSALERWSESHMRADNISVVTLMLDPPGPPRKSSVIKSPPVSSVKPHTSASSSSPEVVSKGNSAKIKHTQFKSSSSTTTEYVEDKCLVPPTSPVPAQSKYGILNYGNPNDSYFVKRLLCKTHIKNTLEHVYDEINRVKVSNTCEEEIVINNNNEMAIVENTLPQSCSSKVEKSVPDVKHSVPDIKPEIPCSSGDLPVEVVTEEKNIQINEVSSSSLHDVKVKNTKTKNSATKAENVTRNLRSREQAALPHPPTRHSQKSKNVEHQSKPESKLPLPVHPKSSAEQKDKVTIMPRPKPFQGVETAPEQLPKINNIRLQKRVPIEIKSKTNVVDNKQKVTSIKLASDAVQNSARVTRSKDVQQPTVILQKQDMISKQNTSIEKDVVADHAKQDLCVGNFSPPKRTFLRSRQQDGALENNEDSVKENIASPSQKSSSAPLKSIKRRNNVSDIADMEPKEKRRTRLDDKKDPKGPTGDQPSSVTSTEDTDYLLGLRIGEYSKNDKKKLANNESDNIDSTSDSTVEGDKAISSKNKMDTLNTANNNEKRALRSNNRIQTGDISSNECRPILRSKNTVTSIVPPKPNPRRKTQWPHTLRHNLRKRQATK